MSDIEVWASIKGDCQVREPVVYLLGADGVAVAAVTKTAAGMLVPGARVEIHHHPRLRPPVGAKFPFQHQLASAPGRRPLYPSWRKIGGDGNCYFRAVYFGLFEQIVSSGDPSHWGPILDCLKIAEFKNPSEEADHKTLLTVLAEAVEGRSWTNSLQLENSFCNPLSRLDSSIIRACKLRVHQDLQCSQNDVEPNGALSIASVVNTGLDDEGQHGSVQRYGEASILPMGLAAGGSS